MDGLGRVPKYTNWHEFRQAYETSRSALHFYLRRQQEVTIGGILYLINSRTGTATECNSTGPAGFPQPAKKLKTFWAEKESTAKLRVKFEKLFRPGRSPSPTREPTRACRPGLVNYANTCFIASTMQGIAASWEAGGVLGRLRQDLEAPSQTIPGPQRQLLFLFLQLCDILNGKQSDHDLNSIYEQFLQTYKQYAERLGMNQVREILDCPTGTRLRLNRIPQQDPEEFLNTLIEMFGLNRSPLSTIRQADEFRLYRKGEQENEGAVGEATPKSGWSRLDHFVRFAPATSPIISIPLINPSSLQGCINALSKEEEMSGTDTIRWPAERLQHRRIRQDHHTVTTKTASLTCPGEPPQALSLQMNLYSNVDSSGRRLSNMRYLKDEGRELLQKLPDMVNIPICVTGPRATTVQQVPYNVSSVICHRGSQLHEGHYITLRFEEGKVIVCDDTTVAEIDDYLRMKGRPPCASFAQFCVQEKLACYVVNLSRGRRATTSL